MLRHVAQIRELSQFEIASPRWRDFFWNDATYWRGFYLSRSRSILMPTLDKTEGSYESPLRHDFRPSGGLMMIYEHGLREATNASLTSATHQEVRGGQALLTRSGQKVVRASISTQYEQADSSEEYRKTPCPDRFQNQRKGSATKKILQNVSSPQSPKVKVEVEVEDGKSDISKLQEYSDVAKSSGVASIAIPSIETGDENLSDYSTSCHSHQSHISDENNDAVKNSSDDIGGRSSISSESAVETPERPKLARRRVHGRSKSSIHLDRNDSQEVEEALGVESENKSHRSYPGFKKPVNDPSVAGDCTTHRKPRRKAQFTGPYSDGKAVPVHSPSTTDTNLADDDLGSEDLLRGGLHRRMTDEFRKGLAITRRKAAKVLKRGKQ